MHRDVKVHNVMSMHKCDMLEEEGVRMVKRVSKSSLIPLCTDVRLPEGSPE